MGIIGAVGEYMEKAILVAVSLPETKDFEENNEEMKNLALACDIEIEDVITQNLKSINKQFYVNSGKIEEIREELIERDISLLIFNTSLSPSQIRNIDGICDCKVMDKSDLILHIFSLRAQSKEAQLQVECAKLKYTLPRLSGSYNNLDRQRGGGDKNKGSGEKKIELDARRIESRIHSLERELKEIQKQRVVQRRLRDKNEVASAALVGYTNAGKSSIMNGCMSYLEKDDKKVFEKDMLFATLTTQIRNITLESKNHFTLSDTVGFISDLPHTLIKAFRSTLEEAVNCDLLIQVIDASAHEYKKHIEVCEQTLREIDCSTPQVLYVYNKCDLSDLSYPHCEDNRIYISAKEESSIIFLLNEIEKRLFQRKEVTLLIPYEKGNLLHELNTSSQIISQENQSDGVLIHLYLRNEFLSRFQNYIISKDE